MITYDVAIIGSGFGGSILAMTLVRQGLRVVMIERGRHPRFAIGESTSPLTNLLIEEISDRFDLPELMPLTTYGEWQHRLSDLSVGLKRGFTYFHHEAGQSYRARADHSNQLMVAANPFDNVADTHWYRADVDHYLQKCAVKRGVEYYDLTDVKIVDGPTFEGTTLELRSLKATAQVRTRFVVDASGPHGFLSRSMSIKDIPFQDYPETSTLYNHFRNVVRCDNLSDFKPMSGTPPYPADDAALHHIFDGGWMWVLKFNNGITSAGVACESSFAAELGLEEGEPAWKRLMERFPSVAKQFANAVPVENFKYSKKLSYQAEQLVGDGWAMLPSAAAFVDPLFSTGFPLTLLGLQRLTKIIGEFLGSSIRTELDEYASILQKESRWVAEFVGGCYAAFKNFTLFEDFSMFYFAAASFSEVSRRIPEAHRVGRFMAADHMHFANGLTECARLLKSGIKIDLKEFNELVGNSIRPLNVAGLNDVNKLGWYGVNLDDVVLNAEKLGFSRNQMIGILESAPWAAGCPISVLAN